MRIAVAMSGGIDSSVTAALLKQEGHDVSGITMRLPHGDAAITAAVRSAGEIGIPHEVIDVRQAFTQNIIQPFCREYQAGRTPNPCTYCNARIKFGIMLDYVLQTGAERLATGHYARLEPALANGSIILKKGRDLRKDQSYFLCLLTTAQLRRVMFPLGDITKQQVHEMASRLGLTSVEREESQEICFIPGGNAAAFVADFTGETALPGPILNTAGKAVGEHHGITAYTVGQRHGLGIASPRPLYVTAIDAARNAVIVGEKESTYGTSLIAGNLNWLTAEPPARPFPASVKIRYRAPDAKATVTPREDNRAYVEFEQPQFAITPGQTVAFYEGDIVLGGGIIATGVN